MRIGNPLPQIQATIAVTGIASPTTLTTTDPQTVTNGSHVDIAPITNQREFIITNNDTANAIYVADTAATTASRGTRVGPLAVVGLTINATVRVLNNSGASVIFTVNQIGA